MKFKLVLMLTAALALSTVASVPGNTQQEQMLQGFPGLASVELTTEQQEQITQIQEDTSSQIQKILTPEQRDKFKTAVQRQQGRRQEQNVFISLNLSEEQQQELQEVFQASGRQVLEILTPQQQQQIRQACHLEDD